MSLNWGPHFIVPSESLKEFSGSVKLREKYDESLLHQELENLGLSGAIVKVTNPWYFRKKGREPGSKSGSRKTAKKTFLYSGIRLNWKKADTKCWGSCMSS